jgi:hypothetical protein
MRFSYQPHPVQPTPADSGREVYRPSLKVRVIGLSGHVEIWGLLDTGSDECILPMGLIPVIGVAQRADELGILQDFAGRPRVVSYGTVDFEVRLKNRSHRWHAKVGFLDDRDEAIWGRGSFLEYFNASFHGPERHFTLRLKSPLPPKIMPVM